jgi:YidC/Oxa1 family membrane protein insertase
MEKNVLLFIALSVLILFASQWLLRPTQPAGVNPPPPSSAPAAQTSPAPAQPAAQASPPTQTAQVEAPSQPESTPLVADASERDIVVENAAVRAVFTTRGAALKHWILRRYKDPSGRPLDLVPQSVKGATKPFTLMTEDAATASTLRNALYRPSADSLTIGSSPVTLSFDYRDNTGLNVHKEFTFAPDQPYIVSFTARVTRDESTLDPTIQWGPALGTGIVERSGTYNPPPQPIFSKNKSVTRIDAGKIQTHPVEEGIFEFVGVDDHYFLTAALSGDHPLHVEYQPVSVPIEGSQTSANFVAWSAKFAAPPTNVRYFAGPKDFDVLEAVTSDLTRAIHFGMFSALVVPLLRSLKWINGYLGNYGWSIIVLTAIINIVMFPLRHKSVVSMRKMQELQPEVKAIQDRYAKLKMSDPAKQKMNVELMNLYRERGVNPASGCVPMLLTLPVLFAFYSMLSVAIELRGAPFIGWIRDLSAHDPLYITPVVMGVTQFIQTKMTPTTGGDPVQQKMMMFMPLIFTSMFVLAPSGLVLYWTASNLWAIGQQVVTNRLIGPPAPRVVRPPAERRVKSAGGGRTEQAAKERK